MRKVRAPFTHILGEDLHNVTLSMYLSSCRHDPQRRNSRHDDV